MGAPVNLDALLRLATSRRSRRELAKQLEDDVSLVVSVHREGRALTVEELLAMQRHVMAHRAACREEDAAAEAIESEE